MVIDAGELMTLNEKDIALKRIRNGVGLLKRAQENLNEEQGKQSEILSEQDALYEELGIKRVENETDTVNKVVDANKTGGKTLTEDQQAELDKQKQNKIDFLAKLKKLEQDSDDETQLDKIQRKRERHLKDLKDIKMNATERAEAVKTIDAIYDAQRDAQIKLNEEKRRKIFDDFTKQFSIEAEDPSEKLAQQREAHLLELETLKLNETEKEEAKKAIKAFYANEEAVLKENDRVLKQEQDLADLETKRQLISQGLDLAIDASGQESKIEKLRKCGSIIRE